MTRTVVHDTFVIARSYPASPARVFTAFADPAVKARWFGDPGAGNPLELDFRVGGRETWSGQAPGGGPRFTYDAVYQDIVGDERIVYTYDMTMNSQRISVSVATIELIPEGSGTRLFLTEQGAFLDDLDTNAQRLQGTQELLEALGRYLEEVVAG